MPKEKVEKSKDDDILKQLKKLAKEHKKKEKGKKEKLIESKKLKTPMTKEDYEKKRSIIKTEIDPETGRKRRVRETGEILESIVTREEHKRINKMSTLNDGLSYSKNLYSL